VTTCFRRQLSTNRFRLGQQLATRLVELEVGGGGHGGNGTQIALPSIRRKRQLDEIDNSEELGNSMKIGIGLPTAIPGREPEMVVAWAQRAEAAGFSSLGVLDRVGYDALEPLAALAAAAAVTSTTRLVSMVVIGPLHNTELLARQAATVDAISGGRLTLGLGVGARTDDYRFAGVDPRHRGEALTNQLARLRDCWEDGEVGPVPISKGGPDLLVGGSSGPALLRMARLADGYVHGGGPPRSFASAVTRARAAWEETGRPGQPQLWAQAYFGFVDPARGDAYLRDYYAFTGAFAERIVAGNLTTPALVADYIRGYEEAGCEHLVLLPTVADLDEVDRLAEALG
jgi:alkanesulfonate monooxygenase SsuD/methylene tetrahydromethanopterin reductase-like flavin-dependent oxidoreductase (luciferase family)